MLQPHWETTPQGIFDYGVKQYERFLEERKALMAAKVRGWYEGL